MRAWQKPAAALAALCVFASPLYADVVPARKAKADRDAAAVEKRLVDLGVDSATARSGAERLTPSELRFFAEDPSRVQNVGGLTGGEWMGGGVFLGLMGFLYFAFVSNQN